MNIKLPCGHESNNLQSPCLPCSKFQSDEKFKSLCIQLHNERLEKQEPSIITKIYNATSAGMNYLVKTITGEVPFILSKEEVDIRLSICADCTENKNGICAGLYKETNQSCGCVVKAKATVSSEQCPLEKWPKVTLKMVDQAKCGGCNKST